MCKVEETKCTRGQDSHTRVTLIPRNFMKKLSSIKKVPASSQNSLGASNGVYDSTNPLHSMISFLVSDS